MANKLRNGDTEIAKLTQWIGRKCRNHNPVQEMTKSGKKMEVGITGAESNVVVYKQGGRTFEIAVKEIHGEKYDDMMLETVGY